MPEPPAPTPRPAPPHTNCTCPTCLPEKYQMPPPDPRRAACAALLAQVPASGLDDAVETLTSLVAFWQGWESRPPPAPPTARIGWGRVIRVEQVPSLHLEGDS